MPLDSDPIITSGRAPDDIVAVIVDIVSHVQFKFLGLMLLIFIMISSDVFINRVLSGFGGAVEYKCPSSWGVFIQSLFLVFCMVGVDTLIRQKII